jgi:hypothetical protein
MNNYREFHETFSLSPTSAYRVVKSENVAGYGGFLIGLKDQDVNPPFAPGENFKAFKFRIKVHENSDFEDIVTNWSTVGGALLWMTDRLDTLHYEVGEAVACVNIPCVHAFEIGVEGDAVHNSYWDLWVRAWRHRGWHD